MACQWAESTAVLTDDSMVAVMDATSAYLTVAKLAAMLVCLRVS